MRKSLLLVLLAAALCGCNVHQFPLQKTFGGIRLHLHYEPDFWIWEHLYDPAQGVVSEQYPDSAVDQDHPGTTSRYNAEQDHGSVRIIIRAFHPGNLDKCIREYTFVHDAEQGYDCDVTLDLDPGEYELAVWSDLSEHSSALPCYNPDDFRSVQLLYADRYLANSDFRDGYRGRQGILVEACYEESEIREYTVTMRRPMAKFEFITTDLSEFLDGEAKRRNLPTRSGIEDYVVEVRYTGYQPCSYSVIEDQLENAATGIKFTSRVQITGESEASLGFDYVFINNILTGGVLTEISVYDPEGELVAHSHQIEVPLRRDHHTVLRGAFLTTIANGGVGIDPGFEGDHNIIVP